MEDETHEERLERLRGHREAKRRAHVWTDAQIMAARAINLIKRRLTPKCEECGVGVDRPNCAMGAGGHCRRHSQDDTRAFDSVIAALNRAAGWSDDYDLRWELAMPLHLYQTFNETEVGLLMDLAEAGGRLTSRSRDERFDSLSSKHAVSFGVGSQWYVSLSRLGEDLVEHFKSLE